MRKAPLIETPGPDAPVNPFRDPMPDTSDHPTLNEMVREDQESELNRPTSSSHVAVTLLIISGSVTVIIGLILLSNQLGNTDGYGILVIGLGGWLLGTGVGYLSFPFRQAAILGLITAPTLLFLLFAMFWLSIIVTAMVS